MTSERPTGSGDSTNVAEFARFFATLASTMAAPSVRVRQTNLFINNQFVPSTSGKVGSLRDVLLILSLTCSFVF
jgi:hypothetical protein